MRNGKQSSVLVLGEDTRSFLSVIRSLGQAGYRVHVVCYDRTSAALRSKYIEARYFYNYQACTQTEWLNNVVKLIEWYQYDLIFPCDERAIYPLWSARHRLPVHTQLAIANQQGLDVLFDKWKTKQAAISCYVPVAKGEIVDLRRNSYSELYQLFGSQFVIKPLQSFEETNLSQRQKVTIVHCEEDYEQYREQSLAAQPYLIEAFFSGKGEGVSVFSVDGEVHAAFAHKRVAEPSSGGGSSYRVSIELDEELLKATQDICHATNYTGVAMFEFRRNPDDGNWILVEVNARFWGSLPLAVFAGVDFPRMYADYLLSGCLPETPILNYRQHVTARALVADLYEIKRELELAREGGSFIKARAKGIFRLFAITKLVTPFETIDSFSRSDLGPFWGEVKMLARTFSGAILKRNRLRLFIRRIETRNQVRKLLKINNNRRILFICYGNIMRSPFAEICLKSLLSEESGNQCDSFGFHLHEQRQSPDNAMKAAKELNYDLSNHKSKWLTQNDINESDIVIYFDERNQEKLQSYYHLNHMFCAADLLGQSFPLMHEISDPYGQSVADVAVCYQQISNAVHGLFDIVREVELCQG